MNFQEENLEKASLPKLQDQESYVNAVDDKNIKGIDNLATTEQIRLIIKMSGHLQNNLKLNFSTTNIKTIYWSMQGVKL